MIPESFIQELLNRVDIVDVVDKAVPLKKAGANFMACCPFHNEKSPSFTVSPTKQFYHCFGCGAHGTAVSFLMEYQGLSFVDAVHDLAKIVGMVVPQEKRDLNGDGTPKPTIKVAPSLYEILQNAAIYYKSELKSSERAINYLKSRGLSGQVAAKFQIGYAPDGWQNLEHLDDYKNECLKVVGLVKENEQGRRYDRFRDRIMFPIHDQKGQIIGFGGRIIQAESEEAKYLNSPETPLFQKGNELYGLFLARRAIKDAGCALVVEGYMDVVALAQFGIEYAVAALGTATTPTHITKLMRQTDTIIFCFDGDNAGKKAAWRAAINALPALKDGLELKFLFLPSEHDPDSYVRKFGKDQLEAEIVNAMPLSAYIVQHLSEDNPLNSQEDRVRFLNDAEPILKEIRAPRIALFLRKKIAELTNLTEAELRSTIKLPNPNQPRLQAMQKANRQTLSIQKRFVLMLLSKPGLAIEDDVHWLQTESEQDKLVHDAYLVALSQPHSKPAALMRALEVAADVSTDPRLINEIKRELHLLDDSLDLSLEFNGVRNQLRDLYTQNSQISLLNKLNEKGLSQLSDDEKQQLRALGVRSPRQ